MNELNGESMQDLHNQPVKRLAGPDEITNAKLILSANRALLCEIWPNMRQVGVEFIKEKKLITLYFYVDKPPSQEELDYDIPGVVSCEMSCDFSEEIEWKEEIVVVPYPEKLEGRGIGVFRRHEPRPPGVDERTW